MNFAFEVKRPRKRRKSGYDLARALLYLIYTEKTYAKDVITSWFKFKHLLGKHLEQKLLWQREEVCDPYLKPNIHETHPSRLVTTI